MSLPNHLITGYRGEQLAARWLRKNGYKIVDANFHTDLGETDIIALDRKKTLCFIEVKTRSPGSMLPPREAVDADKQNRLENNAAAYIKNTKIKYNATEFCIVEVILYDLFTADITLHRNAF